MPFYTKLEPDPALARGYVFLLDAIDAYLAKGRLREAEMVRIIFRKITADYEALGKRAPAKADAYIRDVLRQTAVRPPTTGNLAAAIQSRPIPSTFPAAAVAIADLAVLEAGAVNPRSGGVYWRAQEYGLPVDPDAKPVPGYFMPGYAGPDQAQFRLHPYFQQFGYAKGMPALVRKRPLKARYYLREGTKLFVLWHESESARINRRALSRLAAI